MEAAADDGTVPTPSATSNICALPAEVIEVIVKFLRPGDLCCLRSTCRILYEKTMYRFGQGFLNTVRTDLSRPSLQRLQELSENLALHHYVRGLSISATPGSSLGYGFSWTRFCHRGRLDFPHFQPGVRSLRDALRSLPNCTNFTVRLEHQDHNFNTTDGLYLGPTDAITIILDCVANTGLLVTSFHVDFKSHRQRGVFEMESSRLLFPAFHQNFVNGWANVRELRLHHSMRSTGVTKWVIQLVQCSRTLETLDIDFELGSEAGTVVHALSRSNVLPPIRDLRLSSPSSLEGADLLALLRRFRRTLQALHLHHVFISDVGWREILTALRDDFPVLDHVNFLRLGCSSFPIVPFPCLGQDLSASGIHADRFVYRANQRGVLINSTTPSMSAVLEALLNSAEYF